MATPRLAILNIHKLTPRLGESVSRRLPDSFFDFENLREFEAKSGTARKVVEGIYEDPISAKTPENPPHCHVPLKTGLCNETRNMT